MRPSKREQMIILKITAEAASIRADAHISAATELSRSAAARLCEEGAVLLGGKPVKKNYLLREGDELTVELPEPQPAEAQPQDIELNIVYEDEDIIVINKPVGMVVHPAAGNPDGTLVNALLFHCGDSLSGIGGVVRPGIVHRIDKDTSGLLVAAKNDAAHLSLTDQLSRHEVSRIYYAVLIGNLKEESGTVDRPIGRDPKNRKRMAVIYDEDKQAKRAVTHYEVVERFSGFCFVRCKLDTGRTHQIRVHMASLGHPLLGDPVYGGAKTAFEAKHKGLIEGQCLFAAELELTHPRSGEKMHFSAELPSEMKKILSLLREQS